MTTSTNDPTVLREWVHTHTAMQWPMIRQLLKLLAVTLVGMLLLVAAIAANEGELSAELMIGMSKMFGAIVLCMFPFLLLVMLVVTRNRVKVRFVLRQTDASYVQLEPLADPLAPGGSVRTIAWSDVRKIACTDRQRLVELYGSFDVAVMLYCPDEASYADVRALCEQQVRAYGGSV